VRLPHGVLNSISFFKRYSSRCWESKTSPRSYLDMLETIFRSSFNSLRAMSHALPKL